MTICRPQQRNKRRTTITSIAAFPSSLSPPCEYNSSPSGVVHAIASFLHSSRYLIGQGVGGTFFPPYSETFGRKTLYIVSTFGFCVFSAIVAAVPSLAAIIICRFITGVVSAVPTVVVAGSIEDIYNIRTRVWMIFAWALVGLLALVVGPIFSTYVTNILGWYVGT